MVLKGHDLQRERDSFDDLCRKNYASLLSYARLFVPVHIAQDVVQDALLSVWKRRDKIDLDSSLGNYLLRAVYNRCLNIIKRNKVSSRYVDSYRNKITSLLCTDYLDPDKNPVISKIYSSDLRKTLDSAISSLPDRCAEVFRLSYEEHYSEKEISEILGISVRTVETHIYNALKRLRMLLVSVESH
jgi:RNA polymerase sigma-70 factor (ECF subfamily)